MWLAQRVTAIQQLVICLHAFEAHVQVIISSSPMPCTMHPFAKCSVAGQLNFGVIRGRSRRVCRSTSLEAAAGCRAEARRYVPSTGSSALLPVQ